jgi:SAM-dependent methyltransferase
VTAARGPNRQERYRQEYRRRRPGWRDSAAIFRSMIEEHAPPGARILDVGCGRKGVLAGLAGRVTVGADPDATAVARNRAVRHALVATGERLPFGDASFDAVVSAWVAEHLDRPLAVAREARRVLRPGGSLLFLTPNAWNYTTWIIRTVPGHWHAPLARRMWRREAADTYPVRYRLNTPRRVRAVLSEAGFHDVRVVLNGDPTYVAANDAAFAVSRAVERAFDTRFLAGGRAHLIVTAHA